MCGYTTWYNYYTSVTEEIVERDLEAIAKLGSKIDIFKSMTATKELSVIGFITTRRNSRQV